MYRQQFECRKTEGMYCDYTITSNKKSSGVGCMVLKLSILFDDVFNQELSRHGAYCR